ncbi:YicC family protein [Alistipes sp. OttesenSCG-928-B03]|nr:YicC family protein [Alistipes sp. OttesenSCG-928-B03]
MTGYGKAEAASGKRKITVEVRSLNSKQLDLSVKMPSVFRSQDSTVRSAAGKAMQRGKVDVYVNVETEAGVRAVSIDRALFAEYYSQLRSLGEENFGSWGGDAVEGAVMQAILRMPDVVSSESDEAGDEEIAALMTALNGALAHIDEFRLAEGAILIADILGRIDRIEQLLGEVAPFEGVRAEKIKERIRENIESVGIPVDDNRLEQEMIYYVEKLDVTEEKVRLANHCKYFREVAADDAAPGRKLGFIAQEIGREINTLGSKANEASIQRIVVGMKDELEKIKEQLLNIL